MPNQFTASLWGDEAFSAILSQKSLPQIVQISTRDAHPPLFNILEHFWFQLMGSSEISIRLLTFLFLLIAVFFTYKIGAFLWDRKVGLLAAALTFFNPFLFAYGFEGRMYSLLVAGICASFYFFIKRKWPAYIIATTIALYTQHFATLAIFVQGLWLIKEFFWGNRKVAFSILKSFLAIAIFYSPWLIPLYHQIKMVGAGFWLGRPNLSDLLFLLLKYVSLGLIGLVLLDWTKETKKYLLLLAWFLVPPLLAWVISQKFTPIFYDRYLLYSIPPAFLLVASGKSRVSRALSLFTLTLFILASTFLFIHPTKRPFRDLANYVRQSRQEGDFLVNWNSSAHHLWESKYYQIPAPLYIPEGKSLPFYVGTALMGKEDIISSLPDSNRLGVITSGSVADISLPGYTTSTVQTFGELKFIWLTQK